MTVAEAGSRHLKIRFESQLSRMNCQTFGPANQFGAFRRQRDHSDVGRHDETARQMPAGLIDEQGRVRAGAIGLAISARCRFIASVSHRGMMRAAPLPSFGQIAPKI